MINFEQKGVVSIWVFRQVEDPAYIGKDVLKDLCGIDYYDIDFQDGAVSSELLPLASLLSQLSFSSSFIDAALIAAGSIGIKEAFGAIAQFDFAYDPSKVTKQVSSDPDFIGCFKWHE